MKSFPSVTAVALLSLLSMMLTSCYEDNEMKGGSLLNVSNEILGMTHEAAESCLKKNNFYTVSDANYRDYYVRGEAITLSGGVVVYAEAIELSFDKTEESVLVAVDGEKVCTDLPSGATAFRRMSSDGWECMSSTGMWNAIISRDTTSEEYCYLSKDLQEQYGSYLDDGYQSLQKSREDYEKALRGDLKDVLYIDESYPSYLADNTHAKSVLYLSFYNDEQVKAEGVVAMHFMIGKEMMPLPCSPLRRALNRMPSSVNCDPIEPEE
ncbi:MAG: hypothetical protein IJS13_02580 [Paludibacteraceae bacterium]|nr:hypothetical protein [Paludibacteraceae bacterium]